jgi:hypothetical protein
VKTSSPSSRLLLAALAFALAFAPLVRAQTQKPAAPAPAPVPSAVATELAAIIGRVNQKLGTGQANAAALAPELEAANALFQRHQAEKTEDVARVLLLQAHLHVEFLKEKEKGLALLERVKSGGYPASPHISEAIAMIEAKANPPPPLSTPWTDKVDRAKPLDAYPRPQLQRDSWMNLNGEWEFAIQPREVATPPSSYEGKILVPFAVESRLSGVQRTVSPSERVWYRRTFELPDDAAGRRMILHFGAVDWQADVYINGRALARHEGGFDPFFFDISGHLRPGQPQELVVAVWDPSDHGSQPRGKQVLNPANIFYTAVTGIWQTVWLEAVPRAYVQGVHLTPRYDAQAVSVRLKAGGGGSAEIRVLAAGQEVARAEVPKLSSLIDYSDPIDIRIPPQHARAWTPDDPFLYDVEITLRTGDVVDKVRSYFGLRKIHVARDGSGIERLFLNNRPVFQYGPLDQGWWPDGLYTAPTDEALCWDVEVMKKMGFNMVRKHIKVEPARWYYHCDRLGLLVWQDMPSAMNNSITSHLPPRQQPLDGLFSDEDHAQFRRELNNMVDALSFSPSIVAWVPFNECWGQHRTNEVLAAVKQLDPTRLVDGPSGWNDLGFGDMIDMHDYPGPSMYPARAGRASVLGEFGGLGLAVKGHLWQQAGNWGYRDFGSAEEFTAQYDDLLTKLRPLVAQGLAAAVYTQLTDVEGEVNGFITYDRQVIKIPAEKLAEMHRRLMAPVPAR